MEGVFYDEGDEGSVSNFTYEEGATALQEHGVDNWDGIATATEDEFNYTYAPIDAPISPEMREVASEFNFTREDKQSEDGNWDDW